MISSTSGWDWIPQALAANRNACTSPPGALASTVADCGGSVTTSSFQCAADRCRRVHGSASSCPARRSSPAAAGRAAGPRSGCRPPSTEGDGRRSGDPGRRRESAYGGRPRRGPAAWSAGPATVCSLVGGVPSRPAQHQQAVVARRSSGTASPAYGRAYVERGTRLGHPGRRIRPAGSRPGAGRPALTGLRGSCVVTAGTFSRSASQVARVRVRGHPPVTARRQRPAGGDLRAVRQRGALELAETEEPVHEDAEPLA